VPYKRGGVNEKRKISVVGVEYPRKATEDTTFYNIPNKNVWSDLVMSKHQTNRNGTTFYKTTGLWNLQKCQGQERQRKTWELFQTKGE
jgi:hypothetical protein